MRRLMIGLALLASSAAPSFAQQKPYNALSADEKVERAAADAVDRQYKTTLDKTSKAEGQVRVDPWSNMRSPAEPKTKR